MAYRRGRGIEILKTLLDISADQRKLAAEGEFEGVIGLQGRREALVEELKGLDIGKEDLKTLADELLKSDSDLAVLIERAARDFKSKLERIGKTCRAVKAYTAF